MNEHFLIPSKVVKEEMMKRGLTQKDVAIIIGKSESYISDNLSKERITVEFAQELSVVLGQTPKHWLEIANNYQLAMLGDVSNEVKARNRLLQEYPLKAMQQRGWISKTANLEVIQSEIDSLIQYGERLEKHTSFKRTLTNENLNFTEKFWLSRAISLSTMLPIDNKYDENKLPTLFSLLKKATKSSQVVDKIPEFLHRYGIGFLIVQPLPNTKIDGAAFWLNENSPVIALTVRFDNIGSFWFALMHELMHIKNRDFFSLDNLQEEATSETEKRANEEAAEFLVPQDEMRQFIKNTAPYYSKIKVNNFANKLKVHPGIIVGQLQNRKEIGFNTHHEAMVAVRESLTRPTFTDGWGHPVPVIKN